MDKSCRECIHREVCGLYKLMFKQDMAGDCSHYMCLQMAWDWLNELRSQAKEVKNNE